MASLTPDSHIVHSVFSATCRLHLQIVDGLVIRLISYSCVCCLSWNKTETHPSVSESKLQILMLSSSERKERVLSGWQSSWWQTHTADVSFERELWMENILLSALNLNFSILTQGIIYPSNVLCAWVSLSRDIKYWSYVNDNIFCLTTSQWLYIFIYHIP